MSPSLTRIAPRAARCTAARFSLAAASAQSSRSASAATTAIASSSSSIRTRPSSSGAAAARAFSNTTKPSKAANAGASTSDRPIPGHNMGPILFGVAVATFGIVGASVTDWNLTHDKSKPEGGLKRSATEYFDLERRNTEPTK